jgi:hypothetical protein
MMAGSHVLAAIVSLTAGLSMASDAHAASSRVSPQDLVKAAKAAAISRVDDSRKECNDDRTVEAWLKEVVGSAARSIRWQGGKCVLANKENPRDAGTNWCAHAVITPKRGPAATVEIYFEKPKDGRPGAPFAFRSYMRAKDGWDLSRETWAFANSWKRVHVPGYKEPDNPAECR